MRNTDKDWEAIGRKAPYFGVLSHDRFRTAARDAGVRAEFFASGERQVEQFLTIIREHLDPAFAPRRALDFGCGVGRLTIPLARHVSEVVGLDVSASMLEEARRNCQDKGIRNVTLLLSDDDLSATPGKFDLLLSYIVFQHIPPPRGEAILARLLSHLTEHGMGALHFTYASGVRGWRRVLQGVRVQVPFVHNVLNLLQGRGLHDPYMQMNEYDVNRLLRLLQQHGCHRVHMRFTDHSGYLGVMVFFERDRELLP